MSRLAKIYGSISKVDENDDGTITVHGVASSETKDAAGETVRADAIRGALPDYSKFPALREMHQPSAAGKVLEAEVDDDGVTHIAALVVDPVAIVKVRTGVYAGFSIGGKVLKRDPTDRSVITALRLVEISLVDSPCNPDATLSMWKADLMDEFKPEAADVIARAKTLAKAAGTPRFKDFLFEAGQELMAEHLLAKAAAGEIDLETGTAPVAGEEPVVAATEQPGTEAPAAEAEAVAPPAAETVEPPAAETIEAAADAEPIAGEPDEHDGAGEGDQDPAAKEAAAQIDPAAALADALGKASEAVAAVVPAVESAADPFEDLGKAAEALRAIGVPAESEDLAKGLYSVSRFADLLESFSYLQSSAACEADCENDNSPIPAKLADAIKNLGGILIEMAQEEVAELIAGLRGPNGEAIVEVIYAADGAEKSALAEQIVGAVSANADLIEKAGKRNSGADAKRIQESHDHMAKLGAVCDKANCPADDKEAADTAEQISTLTAENERLAKALGEAAPAVEAITKTFTETVDGLRGQITDLEKKFEDLDQTPIPARTAGPALVRTIEKGADSAGLGGAGGTPQLTQEQVTEAFEKLSDEAKGDLLVRVALANPTRIQLPGGQSARAA